ncbi:insulinase family protein [Sphingomonas sp. BT-65]|uniref:M16 family metallopeptidase n=1 Tax=Sphingomonas sp. BT-65 TaxID=2989821 RepID=UPI0022356A97|nr:pitrilysin family protein [Sphingomonas sp. BT-65]MCW4463161.1 insulinase family protein [Sphingomonas sp. BT-65]
MRRMIASLMAAALIAAPAFAQELPSTPPPIPAPKAFNVPASETYTLGNGMKVTLVPYGVAPKVVVSLQTYAGQLNEAENTWLALLAVDMMKEGAAGMTGAQIAQKAADMGGGLGIGSGLESSGVTLNVLSERAAEAIALVADVAQRPAYPDGELARVKANWNRRLAVALSQPGTLANAAITRAYYGPDHPYGRVLPTPQQFGAYTTAQLKAWHAANYGAKRSHLYIAGKFDAAAVKAAIEKAFGGWAAGADRLSLPPTPKPGPQVLLVDRPGAPQSTFSIAYPAPRAGTAEDIPMRVSNALLGGSFSSRITRNIREAKGYTYSPGSSVAFYPANAVWTFNADVTTAVTGPALKEVFHEIRTLQATPPGEEEAGGMRQYMAGLFVIQNSTPGALVNTIATRDSLGLPRDWMDKYVPATLAVTPAQMSEAAKNFPLDKLTLVVVGDLKVITPQLQALPELKGIEFKTVTVP